MQRRQEKLERNNLRMVREKDGFINEGCDAEQISDPYLWQVLREVAGLTIFTCVRVHGIFQPSNTAQEEYRWRAGAVNGIADRHDWQENIHSVEVMP